MSTERPDHGPDTRTLEGCVTQARRLGCELVSTGYRHDGRILLCHRTEDDTWITWRTFDKGSLGFYHGRYDMTEAEAREDFYERTYRL